MGVAGALIGGSGQIAENLLNGRPWHEGVGSAAATWGAIGLTLGLAAPVIAATDATLAASGGGAAAAQRILKGPIADELPQNLPQQLAMNAARSGQGAREIMRNLADAPRLIANYGKGEWVKMQSVVEGKQGKLVVHWFRNLTTGANVEYKFKDLPAAYK